MKCWYVFGAVCDRHGRCEGCAVYDQWHAEAVGNYKSRHGVPLTPGNGENEKEVKCMEYDEKCMYKHCVKPEDIIRNYMNMTDYAYHHYDLGMLDLEYADWPEDERLDAAAEHMFWSERDRIVKDYERDMALFLHGFFNMPADGRYKGRESEGKVTDLSEKDWFKALFVSADKHMADEFVEKGGHAWDGMLDGKPIRYQRSVGKDGKVYINLRQTLSLSEGRDIYKATVWKERPEIGKDGHVEFVPAPWRLHVLFHGSWDLPIDMEGTGFGEEWKDE